MPRGFIIGGFRLPTVGHRSLIEFASRWCEGDLDVMLDTADEEAIPGAVPDIDHCRAGLVPRDPRRGRTVGSGRPFREPI